MYIGLFYHALVDLNYSWSLFVGLLLHVGGLQHFSVSPSPLWFYILLGLRWGLA